MWKFLFLWVLPCYSSGEDAAFECGAHGRFEYCIDGIPGCVIGCHCHPGYYFDTETKICEPSSKLTLNYRRQYMSEPTRVPNAKFLLNVAESLTTLPTITTTDLIDEHINDITKNADDLGDWLYNQFFKTIENQVINNTNKDNHLTRRGGRVSVPKHNKLKRRARRRGSNKHRKKKKKLRGKLLRIADMDDSLFDDSASSKSETDNSDSRSSDDDDSNSSSYESEHDEKHGHRKILMINKVPKPPLPSLVFLPNMNTPYYPPIGLPPPPVMPMYPMIPVPPMVPPFPQHLPHTYCEENETTTTTTLSTLVTSTPEALSTTTEMITKSTAPTDEPSMRKQARKNHKKGKKIKQLNSFETNADEDKDPPSFDVLEEENDQMKFLERLRQRMNEQQTSNLSAKRQRKQFDNYKRQLLPPNTLIENDMDEEISRQNNNFPVVNLEPTSQQDNVDFKYLSQLIHKSRDNKTQNVPQNLQDSIKMFTPRKQNYQDFSVPLDGRRMEKHVKVPRNGQTDDSYYSNLGRQIATMIRTMDADNDRQFNIEIEKVHNQKSYDHPFFNENGPRTFWERSVRSPLKIFHPSKNRFDYLKNSNELLFNIENKVETSVSTVPTLSLQEIENMIKIIEKARTQFGSHAKIKNRSPSAKALNINLWPQEIKQSKKPIKSSVSPNLFNINRRLSISYSNNTRPEILNTKQNNMEVYNLSRFTDRINMHKLNDVLRRRGLQKQGVFRNKTAKNEQPLHTNHFTLHSSDQHRLIPTVHNYKNLKKYFFDDSNQYSFQNDNFHYSSVSRRNGQPSNPSIPSSYFHHEINHVDYIP